MRDTAPLATARLMLRARTSDDADALFATMADPDVMRWWSHPPVATRPELRARFAEVHPDWRTWAIERAGVPGAIGFVAAGEKRQGDVSEISYLLARAAWGTGIACEAVAAVIARLFAEAQRRVFADVDPDHAASMRLLHRLGFTLEGRMRAEWHTHIGVRDSLIFGLLRDDRAG